MTQADEWDAAACGQLRVVLLYLCRWLSFASSCGMRNDLQWLFVLCAGQTTMFVAVLGLVQGVEESSRPISCKMAT